VLYGQKQQKQQLLWELLKIPEAQAPPRESYGIRISILTGTPGDMYINIWEALASNIHISLLQSYCL
jgi:hypothetical protein